MNFKFCMAAILLLLLQQKLYAQHTCTGTVFDKMNMPVASATVNLQHSGIYTLTDSVGNFSIILNKQTDTLLISHVGYKPVLIAAGKAKKPLIIILTDEVNPLNEVVVIGYGTTTRKLNTGSTANITADEIEKQPVANPLAAMAGRIPGLTVTQNNGVPGSFYHVLVRGQSSLTQGSEPLFVIDGVPYAPNNTPANQLSSAAASFAGGGLSPFNSINPADIESIDVLKDADATAIYGSRGANGVILITTKKGSAGKTAFTANVYTGISTVTRTMSLLNTQQYLQMRHEAFANDSVVPAIYNAPDLLVWDTTRYTDFKKLLIGGTAHTTDVQAALTGGNNNTQFLISGTCHKETTVYPGHLADNRGAVNLNLNHTSADQKLTVTVSAMYSADKNAINATDLTRYINLAPDAPQLYDSTGKLNWQQGGVVFYNPLSYLYETYTAQTDNLLSNLALTYRVLPHFTVKVSMGYNTYTLTETSTIPIAAQNPAYNPKGYAAFAGNNFKTWIVEPQATYSNTFGKYRIDLLAGGTWQKTINNYTSLSADGYSNDALLGSIGAASTITVDGNDASDYRYQAVFGRITINRAGKYILNFSGRRDGSSRFGPGRQYAGFGAAGAAWIFSTAPFIRTALPFLSYGKLRASYGTTGNDQIGDYQYLDTWSSSYYTYQHTHGLYPTRLFNANYGWEVNRKADAAVELGFFQDRILLIADYYINRSSNALIQYQLPLQTGFASVLKNFSATVQNSGLEVSLTSKNITGKNFSWSTSLNLTLPRNKLIAFPGLAASAYANRYVVGKSINLIKGYGFLGVNPQTGVFEFNDVNKDGKLDANDLMLLGDLDPKYYGGFLNIISCKGFEAEVFFEFRKQTGKNFLSSVYNPYGYPPGAMGNQPVEVLQRWQTSGDVTPVQKFSTTYGTTAYTALNYLGSS
ncbi:MAG TPA: SusC/RagA family TonB-linked outer membrane protein, partial [Chitinophagaceae bacterium]|nr:SusC/RagA family TonB-linked outer membrane protein [Chitinophagaceae bacterium]